MTRPSNRRAKRGVHFNLPLSRKNTQYSETSTSHLPNLTKEQMDRREEQQVADLLLDDEDERPRKRIHASDFEDPSRPAAPASLTNTPGPLQLQLMYAALEQMDMVPPDDVPPPVPRVSATQQASSSSHLKRRRSNLTHPDGTPLSFHFSKAYYNNDEQEYIIPPTSHPSSPSTILPELRIWMTKDWSARKLAKHQENELMIYRVPKEHMLYFGMIVREHGLIGLGIRKPVDDDDEIKVLRHGHPSWDTGYKDETWYLIGKDKHVISHVLTRVDGLKPRMWVRMKRYVKARTEPIWRMPQRIAGVWSFDES